MTTKRYADIRVNFTVCFDDDGDFDLRVQAIEAAAEMIDLPIGDFDIAVIGAVRETEMLEAKTDG